MKKLTILIPVSLLLLFGCGGNGNNGGQTAAEGQDATPAVREVSSDIAYIRIDSLLSRYDMYKDLSAALEEKAEKAESEITSKGRSLERQFADAQEKMEKGLVTRAQAAELQEKLQRQERNFYEHREKVQQELGEENIVMMNNISHSLNKFLEEFNADYRYGMILTTSGGTPVIHADPRLDITDIVAEELNKRYAAEKTAAN